MKNDLFFEELKRLLPRLPAFETVWECRVPGRGSLKQPDKLYVMPDRYIHIEFGKFERESAACVGNDSRLELIANDIGLPEYVIHIDIDVPRCVSERRLHKGVTVDFVVDLPFHRLMTKSAEVIEECMRGPAPNRVERMFVVV